jgi:hypothetical protein
MDLISSDASIDHLEHNLQPFYWVMVYWAQFDGYVVMESSV